MSTDNTVSLAAYDDYCEARKRPPFEGALSPSSPEIVALPIHDGDAIHSTDPEECLGAVVDAKAPPADAFKPEGLWYGLGRSWFEWTEVEHFHEWIGHVYRLHLASERRQGSGGAAVSALRRRSSVTIRYYRAFWLFAAKLFPVS